MTEQKETVLCKMCCQEIDTRARKCPFCHQWQNKISTFLLNPRFSGLLVIIGFLSIPYYLSNRFDSGENFQQYLGQIEISESEMKFGENSCGPSIVILGKVMNRSKFSWKDVRFELKFFDKDGKLIDADQEEDYSLILTPEEESLFKVSLKIDFPVEQYVSYEIRILSAKDERVIF